LPKRVHAQLIAKAAEWVYKPAEPSDAEKLAEVTSQKRLAEAELVFNRVTQPSEEQDYRWPTESELTDALTAFVDVLGEESPKAIRSRFHLGKMLLPTDPDRAMVELERSAELADKSGALSNTETIDIWAQTATQLALQLEFDRARRWYAKLSAVVPDAQRRRELPRFLEVLMDGMQVQWTARDIAPFEKVLAAFQRLQGEGIRDEVFEVLSQAAWSSAQLRFPTDAEGQLIWTNSVRYAERALRLNPDHHRALQAFALASWRLGQVSEGLEAIADRVNRVGDSTRLTTIDFSLVALIRHRLSLADAATLAAAGEIDMKFDPTLKAPLTADEHRQRAREALARAKALMQPAADGTPSPWANDEDAKALIAEAEELIGGAP
jgi:tetratricopeptide (TPR) repeat protein